MTCEGQHRMMCLTQYKGYLWAMDLNGNLVWKTYLGRTPSCGFIGGVAGTATVASVTIAEQVRSVAFIGGGDAHFYALDATTGQVIWKTSFGSAKGSFYSFGL